MEISDRRSNIERAIAEASVLAHREGESIELVAVSKGRTATEIEPLLLAGQRDFGENRVQEALHKWPSLLARFPDVRLHAIGRVQSNKAREIIRLFKVVHSLDRLSLLDALTKEAQREGRFPSVYVQVNIGEEEQKGGCPLAEVGMLVDAVRKSPLPLAGLMAIPPLGLDPAPFFALLAKIARRHDATGLSMGMSSDFRTAVMLGATCVRIGTALFGD
jgi:pyridoxal phosphate enzyme (YggS family)